MNFDFMPELKWPWAYPALLLVTGVAVGVLYRRLQAARLDLGSDNQFRSACA